MNSIREDAAVYAGPAVIETFGETGFEPVNKPEAWAFTEKQQNLYLEYRNLSMPVVNEYIPGDETSFTIIAFPVPAIGEHFPEIFKETIRSTLWTTSFTVICSRRSSMCSIRQSMWK